MLTRTLTLAWGVAIVVGAVQVLINALRHAIGNDFIWLSREYVWMTPAGYLMLFTAVAVPLVLVGAVWRRAGDARVAAFVFGSLGALALTLLVPRLHHLAALAVAVGVGTRVSAWFASNESGRLRALRRVALVLAGSLALAGLTRSALSTRSLIATSTEPPPAAPGAPNVLVVILDTVRAASMSFLGYPRATTPHLGALGAEGAVFSHAFATAPWTLPSHAGMFTGLYPSQTTTDWREPLNDAPITLAEALAQRGYRTGAFVANHFYTSYESGLGQGFERLKDYRVTLRQTLLSTTLTQTNLFFELLHGDGVAARLRAMAGMDLRLQTMWVSDRKLAPQVTQEFLDWQADVGDERPFFAFLNYYDAHLPYDPPSPWREQFSATPEAIDLYDGAIAYIDDSLGRLFAELRRRGALDRTLVIVSSDHGELFGEHGLHGHGNSLYLPELHVPLIVRYPAKVRAGVRLDTPVTLRDLMSTVLDAAGQPGTAPGTSWLPLIAAMPDARGSEVVAEVRAGVNTAPEFPVSRGPMQSVITDSLHYIRNGDAVEELFAWRRDPAETDDQVREGRSAEQLEKLRRALAAALELKGLSPQLPRQDP